MNQICALSHTRQNIFNLAPYFTEEVADLLNDPFSGDYYAVIEKMKQYIDKTPPVIEDASFLVHNCPSLSYGKI